MERWFGKVAVVTGASTGIGASIALKLAKHGMVVVGLARSEDKLKNVAASSNGKVHPYKCDLKNEKEIIGAFRYIEQKFGGVDLLVNNAAYLSFSSLTDGLSEEWKAVLDTNVLALCICNREALKSMRNRDGHGHIININSICGHEISHAFDGSVGMYPPSKFAVTALSKSLRKELKNRKLNIKVTNLSPGLIHTDMGMKVIDHLKVPIENRDEVPPGSLISQDVTDVLVGVISLDPRVEIHEIIFQHCAVDY